MTDTLTFFPFQQPLGEEPSAPNGPSGRHEPGHCQIQHIQPQPYQAAAAEAPGTCCVHTQPTHRHKQAPLTPSQQHLYQERKAKHTRIYWLGGCIYWGAYSHQLSRKTTEISISTLYRGDHSRKPSLAPGNTASLKKYTQIWAQVHELSAFILNHHKLSADKLKIKVHLRWLASTQFASGPLCVHMARLPWDRGPSQRSTQIVFFISLDTILPSGCNICREVYEWTFTLQIPALAVSALAELRWPEPLVLRVASSGHTQCDFCSPFCWFKISTQRVLLLVTWD